MSLVLVGRIPGDHSIDADIWTGNHEFDMGISFQTGTVCGKIFNSLVVGVPQMTELMKETNFVRIIPPPVLECRLNENISLGSSATLSTKIRERYPSQ